MDQPLYPHTCYHLVIEAGASSAYAKGVKLDIKAAECLRYLPGRRSVWQAVCRGEPILLKVFDVHARQAQDADREWRHSNKLHQSGLDVAAPLFMGSTDDGLIAIAFEFIANGEGLADYLERADLQGMSDALRQLVRMHSKQHQSGCYQSDDHLGNYLWSDDRLWMLDAGSCMFVAAPVSMEKRVDNMAMLAANIPLPLRAVYDRIVAEEYDLKLPGLDLAISRAISRRAKNYLRKTRRACSEFEHEQRACSTWLACRDIDPGIRQKLLKDPDHFFGDRHDMLKNGRTCSVVDFEVNGKEYVLKRYNQKSLGYRLAHAFMTPRALSSWSNGHVLRLFGIATPRPVACYMVKCGRIFTKGYLLMEKTQGEPLCRLGQDLLGHCDKDVAEEFARRVGELEALQATHCDMKASNFIVDQSGVLHLIDLDSLVFHCSPRSYERRKRKDLERFMRNWDDRPKLIALFESGLFKASLLQRS